MRLALHEANKALEDGDYPVGAVLTINSERIDQTRNSILTEDQTTAHAEQKLLSSNSAQLRKLINDTTKYNICLYTTLEPCLMCIGTAILHRIRRIVVACPDPHGGATKIIPGNLGGVYAEYWPVVEIGLMRENSADLIVRFLKKKKFSSWEKMLTAFLEMQESWKNS